MSVVKYKGKEYKATGSNLLKFIRLDNSFTYDNLDSVEKYFYHKGFIFTEYTDEQGMNLFDGLRENLYSSSNLLCIFHLYKRYNMNTLRIRKNWVVNLLEKRKNKRTCNTEEFYREYFEEDYIEAMLQCNNKPPRNYDKDTWIKLGYSETVALDKIREQKKKTAGSLESFITRFGPKLGLQRYTEFRNNVGYSNTLDYYIEKFGKKEGTEKYKNKNFKNSFTSSRSGHEKNGTLKEYNDQNNKRSESNKYESLIKKFGEDRAREILFLRAGFMRTKKHKTSKIAYRFFIPIYKFLRKNGIDRVDILWGVGDSKEKLLYNKNSKFPKLYDFCVESLKIIIEFDGKAWHPRKEKLTEKEWNQWKTPFGNSAEHQYKNDRLKDIIAEQNGYYLLRVHEDDMIVRREEILSILKDRISENIKDNTG